MTEWEKKNLLYGIPKFMQILSPSSAHSPHPNSFLRAGYGKEEKSNFTVEKPGKHYVGPSDQG